MKGGFGLTLLAVVLMTAGLRGDVAISIRYFKEEGTSHYHLYLYTDDGKVIRQLTAPEDAQDTAPAFSKNGKEIVFTRETKGRKQVCSIGLDGTHWREMKKTPEWYDPSVSSGDIYTQEDGGGHEAIWTPRGNDLFMGVPDGKQELIRKGSDKFKHDEPQFEGNACGSVTILDLSDGKETRLPIAGDQPDNYCDFATHKRSPFLIQPGLRVAFFWQHQNSTDASRLGVIDLDAKRALFLSQNPAFAVRHGTRTGFFCVCEQRYQPLGKTTHTVNCLYLDWWDAKLERTRFANAISLFGGASVRVKGQPQLNISPDEHD